MACRILVFFWAVFLAFSAHSAISVVHWVTPSGARVHFVESQALPILDVQVDFAAGSMFDPPGKSGLAALTHLVLDLGAGGLDENAIADHLADVGAQLGGGSDTDRANVHLRTLVDAEKKQAALKVLRMVLHQPHFDSAVFEREKGRAIAGLKETLTRPEGLAARAFWQAMYPSHPYGIQPSPEGLEALRVEDARALYRQLYRAGNATITLVGKISRAEAEQIAENIASGLPSGSMVALPPAPSAPSAKLEKVVHPASQAHIYLGLPAIARGHPDFFPLLVGNYTLGGGGFVSRLMKEVRDRRGYAYSVYSHFSPLRQAGPFQIGLQTKREQAGEALALTKSILEEFVRSGPTEEELAAAKANLTGSFPLRLDSNRKILDNVAAMAFYGLPLDYLDNYRQKVSEVTVAQVTAAFARHIRIGNLVTVMVAAD